MVSIVPVSDDRSKPSDAELLERLTDRADRGRLKFESLRELAGLYRSEAARLSMLRGRGDDPEAVRYLNALCLRAHGHVYAPPPRLRMQGGFWLRRLPGALGRTLGPQLLSAALLLVGGVLGALLVLDHPDNLAVTVPSGMYDPSALRHLHDSPAAQREFLERRAHAFGINAWFAGALFSNNTRVGLLSFAVGILAGLPTILLLIYNGATLGGFATIFLRGPLSMDFLAWLVPHAIPELLAIVLCSAGGLAMGRAVVAPGRAGRARALRAAAGDALQLVFAAVPLFIVAAAIESFVRESTLSTPARFSMAAVSVLALCAYGITLRHLAMRTPRADTTFLE